MSNEIAIKVENVRKTFVVPHEKHTSLKSVAINSFRKKGYEEFEALKDISFEVKKGEFFGIIGRNGSGKSTLLKMLAGIYVPDSGKITINGKLSPFLELGVGFNPELTGRENLYLGGAILGLSRKEVSEKFDKIVHFAELEEFIDMKFKNYSSGMAVRLAFSLSINVHAEILLMDEVLAVGDSNFQAKCIDEFVKYRREGRTVLLVSHDVNTVKRYCDQALLIKDGLISIIGKPKDVVGEYLNDDRARTNESEGLETSTIKSKNVYLKKIVTFDKNNKPKRAFSTGDKIKVRLYFQNIANEEKLNFGLQIFGSANEYIYGINTFNDKYIARTFSVEDSVDLILEDIPLKNGLYYFRAGIMGETQEKSFDYNVDMGKISIISNDDDEGFVGIKHEWKA